MLSSIKNKVLTFFTFALVAFTLVMSTADAKTTTPEIKLNGANFVAFNQKITPLSVEMFAAALFAKRMILPRTDKLYVLIESNGGDYDQSKLLLNMFDQVPNISLVCITCQSGAGFAFMSSKAERLVRDDSLVMMHELYNGHATKRFVTNQLLVDDLVKASDEFDGAIAKVLKMELGTYQRKIAGKSLEMNGKDAVKNHLADKVIAIACDLNAALLLPRVCGDDDEQ